VELSEVKLKDRVFYQGKPAVVFQVGLQGFVTLAFLGDGGAPVTVSVAELQRGVPCTCCSGSGIVSEEIKKEV
jgi:hypothetical protein